MLNFLYDYLSNSEVKVNINDLKYVNINNKILFVQGYKDVLKIENDNVVIKTKIGELDIIGNDLKIIEIDKSTLKIIGKIIKVENVGDL